MYDWCDAGVFSDCMVSVVLLCPGPAVLMLCLVSVVMVLCLFSAVMAVCGVSADFSASFVMRRWTA